MFVKADIKENLPDISIGDFAMDILESMKQDPNALRETPKPVLNSGPDLSKVEVPDDFVSMVTEGKKPIKQPIVKVTQKPKVIKESNEDKLESLVERLETLLEETKSVLEEISAGATTVGNVGVSVKKKGKKTNPFVDKIKRKYGIC